jgi:hypothetical protein
LIASEDGADGSVLIHQDAKLYAGCLMALRLHHCRLLPDGVLMCTWRVGL